MSLFGGISLANGTQADSVTIYKKAMEEVAKGRSCFVVMTEDERQKVSEIYDSAEKLRNQFSRKDMWGPGLCALGLFSFVINQPLLGWASIFIGIGIVTTDEVIADHKSDDMDVASKMLALNVRPTFRIFDITEVKVSDCMQREATVNPAALELSLH